MSVDLLSVGTWSKYVIFDFYTIPISLPQNLLSLFGSLQFVILTLAFNSYNMQQLL